jgi:5'-nucleotidase
VITTTVPAPAVPLPTANPVSNSFRLTLLHNNDGESKYVVGDSIANYGGITRFKTVLDRLRGEADSYSDFAEATGTETKGTLTISSGDNYLAGLNLRASFQRYDAHQGPTTPRRSATTSTTSGRSGSPSSSPGRTRRSS